MGTFIQGSVDNGQPIVIHTYKILSVQDLYLYDFGEMAVGSQLKALLFRPDLHVCQSLVETCSPVT